MRDVNQILSIAPTVASAFQAPPRRNQRPPAAAAAPPVPTFAPPEPAQEAPASSNRTLLYVGIGVGTLALVGLGVFLLRPKKAA